MSLEDALNDYFTQRPDLPANASEVDRLRAEQHDMAVKVGKGEARLDELHDVDDRLSVAVVGELVPDPFLPGQLVRPDMAAVHPARRFEVAIRNRRAQENQA